LFVFVRWRPNPTQATAFSIAAVSTADLSTEDLTATSPIVDSSTVALVAGLTGLFPEGVVADLLVADPSATARSAASTEIAAFCFASKRPQKIT